MSSKPTLRDIAEATGVSTASVSMILNGECGAFNPILLECLKDIQDELVEMYTHGHKEN